MKRVYLAPLVLLFAAVMAHGQAASVAPLTENSGIRADRAIKALKRLDNDVIVYRSLGEFEEGNKLARVPIETFLADLREVTIEVQADLASLPESRAKIEIRNALASYQDGAFWWQQVYQPRVINVSSLTSTKTRTTPDAFLATQTPYTVAIYWRQANKYLQRVERMSSEISRQR